MTQQGTLSFVIIAPVVHDLMPLNWFTIHKLAITKVSVNEMSWNWIKNVSS